MNKNLSNCVICNKEAFCTEGRINNAAAGIFDHEKTTNGPHGMICAIRFECPDCGTYMLYDHDYFAIRAGNLNPKEILAYMSFYPKEKGCIPLSSWVESRNKD